MKDTPSEVDKAWSRMDKTLLHEDSAIAESLQVTRKSCQTIYISLFKKMPPLISFM